MTAATDYSAEYDPETDFDRWYTTLSARRIGRSLLRGERVLEVGSATGLLTAALAGCGCPIVCVERSASYVTRARARGLKDVVVEESSIEEFRTGGLFGELFDHVLAISVLHEVEDQRGVVEALVRWMKPGGRLHVTLPNPRSLHRLSALGSGMIGDLCAASERGERFSTLRVQYPEEICGLMAEFGLEEERREGVLVKPLPNAGMERLSDELIEAYDALAEALPGHGAMNYFVFRKEEGACESL